MEYTFHDLGDQALLLSFPPEVNPETQSYIKEVTDQLIQNSPEWMLEVVPSFSTIAVHYDSRFFRRTSPRAAVREAVEKVISSVRVVNKKQSGIIEIPVLYGGKWGPDLEEVARYHELEPDEVVKRHHQAVYLVYAIGFAPGFPFLGGMDPSIATPRKKRPRVKIPAGAVGIAGEQTGVYPMETPGGWQLIGQTPIPFFDPENEEQPTRLQAGDRVRFVPVNEEEFNRLKEEQS